MAEKKKPAKKATPRISADRAEMLRKSNVRAGKSKSTLATRKVQNANVKDGTIRLGKSGKSYNVYDAKTATWKRGVVKAAPGRKSEHMNRPKPPAKGTPPKKKSEKKGWGWHEPMLYYYKK